MNLYVVGKFCLISYSETKASIPRASDKVDDWVIDWLID